MRTVLAVAMFFMVGACDPLDWPEPDEEDQDFRWGAYNLESDDPIVLWEGASGSTFQIADAELFCTRGGLGMAGSYDRVNWELLGAGGTVEQSGTWHLGFLVYCSLNGPLSMRFRYTWTGDSGFTQDGRMVEGCLQFGKRLPRKWDWPQEEVPVGQGGVFDRRYLPDLMPVLRYRAREPCKQPPSISPH